jgi:hypothetical protein
MSTDDDKMTMIFFFFYYYLVVSATLPSRHQSASVIRHNFGEITRVLRKYFTQHSLVVIIRDHHGHQLTIIKSLFHSVIRIMFMIDDEDTQKRKSSRRTMNLIR